MGQMTYGVLYGIHQAPPDDFEEGWHTLITKYKPRGKLKLSTPSGDGDHDFLGFWVAVGASGNNGVPYLEAPFALDAFISANKAYFSAWKRAAQAWETFEKWCKRAAIDVSMAAPRLYLVMTEVA